MFQTLKPKKSNEGEIEYVARSSEIGYSRRPRKHLACTSCKLKKLRCSKGNGDSCNPCQNQGNECSHIQAAKTRPQIIPAQSQQLPVNGSHDHQQRESQQWSVSLQQGQRQPQASPKNHQYQPEQADTDADLRPPDTSYFMHIDESDPIVFGRKVSSSQLMPLSSHGVVSPSDDVCQDSFNAAGFTSCDVNFSLTGLLHSDDEENHGCLGQSPLSLSHFLQDPPRPTKDQSTSHDPMIIDTMLGDKRRNNACQHPITTRTPLSPTTTSTQWQKETNNTNNHGRATSPPPIEFAGSLELTDSPKTLDCPPRKSMKEVNTSCDCIHLLLSAYERLQIQLIWPSSNDHDNHALRCVAPPPINIDETLECQRCILTSITTFLACKDCGRRSAHIMLSLSICKEIIRSIKVFGDYSSSLSASRGGILTTVPESGISERRASKRPRSGDSSEISANDNVITSNRWRLDDHVEMQVVWSLVDLRAKRVKKLIHQLEEVAVANDLACLRVAQTIRRQFGD